MLIYDDIRFKLNNVKPKLDDLRLALDLDKAKVEIEELEHKAAEPEFWNDPSESQKVLQRTKQLKDKVANYAALYTMYEDVVTTIEMAEEMEDESLFPEVQEGFAAFPPKSRKGGLFAPLQELPFRAILLTWRDRLCLFMTIFVLN